MLVAVEQQNSCLVLTACKTAYRCVARHAADMQNMYAKQPIAACGDGMTRNKTHDVRRGALEMHVCKTAYRCMLSRQGLATQHICCMLII
jgi:hypothetical protein